jgi:hypothetical protein
MGCLFLYVSVILLHIIYFTYIQRTLTQSIPSLLLISNINY